MKEVDRESVHKELDLIQSVINRMGSNSFEVKKWHIGILSLILAFMNEELLGGNIELIWILFIPILSFWFLDSFFLSTEKFYREVYKWVVKYRGKTEKYLYDLNSTSREFPEGETTELKLNKNRIINTMFSKTIWPFYITPILIISVLIIAKRIC